MTRPFVLISVSSMLAVVTAFTVLGSPFDDDELDQLIDAAREYRKGEEARRDAEGEILLQKALAVIQKEKELATERLSQAERERRREQTVNEVRNWALGGFESADRQRLPEVDKLNSRFARWRNARTQYRRIFLEFPNESRGAIRSGRALNFFVDTLGEFALDHRLSMEKIAATKSNLSASLVGLTDPKERELTVRTLTGVEQTRVMIESIGKRKLPKYAIERLRFERGGQGGTIVITNQKREGALPLTWPEVIRTNAKYSVHCDALAEAKAAAIRELSAGVGVAPETQRKMLIAANGIATFFRRDWLDHAVPPKNAYVFARYNRAKQFVRGLRTGVLRFVEAQRLSDVQPDEPFDGKTIGELMVYMSENGLRFAKSDVNTEAAYKILFDHLVDYYWDVNGLRVAAENGDQEIARWDAYAKDAGEFLQRNTLKDLENAMKQLPGNQPQHWSETLLNLADSWESVSKARLNNAIRTNINANGGP